MLCTYRICPSNVVTCLYGSSSYYVYRTYNVYGERSEDGIDQGSMSWNSRWCLLCSGRKNSRTNLTVKTPNPLLPCGTKNYFYRSGTRSHRETAGIQDNEQGQKVEDKQNLHFRTLALIDPTNQVMLKLGLRFVGQVLVLNGSKILKFWSTRLLFWYCTLYSMIARLCALCTDQYHAELIQLNQFQLTNGEGGGGREEVECRDGKPTPCT